jgi:hypothetical protein
MTALELAVRKAMAKLVTAFGQKIEDTDETLLVYLEALRDLDSLDIDGGVTRAIRAERYFPRPSILRAYALEERTARTVTVRAPRAESDALCPLCGTTKLWDRTVQQPDPDPKYFTPRVIESGEFKAKTLLRPEIEHRWECPLRRADQPSLTLTRGAA